MWGAGLSTQPHPIPYSRTRKGINMNWNFLISFGIGLAVYMVFLGVFALIKRRHNKKLAEQDKQKFENDEQSKD